MAGAGRDDQQRTAHICRELVCRGLGVKYGLGQKCKTHLYSEVLAQLWGDRECEALHHLATHQDQGLYQSSVAVWAQVPLVVGWRAGGGALT